MSEQNKYPFLANYTTPVKKSERKIVGRQDEMNRILAAFMRPELCNVILLAEAGSGKALANDTLIPVADARGYVKISDLKLGDIVFDENGDRCIVEGVFPQGKKHAYRVTLNDDTSVVCCDEHLWNAKTRRMRSLNNDFKTVTLREIIDKDVIKTGHKGEKIKNWYLPTNKALKRHIMAYDIKPYTIGILSQSMCTDIDLKMRFNIDSLHKAKYIFSRLNLYYDADYNIYATKNYTHSDKLTFKYYYNQRPYDMLFNKKISEIDIPKEYLNGSVEQRFDLLHGIMDMVGYIREIPSGASVGCYLRSKNVHDFFLKLATSLGLRVKSSYLAKYDKYEVRFSVSDEDKLKLFSYPKHIDKLKSILGKSVKKINRKYDSIGIKSVEDLKEEVEMTCIKVSSESSLFQCTTSHIVTHNTMLVQGTMERDVNRKYLEVDLSKMIVELNDPNEMANRLKSLFDEVERYGKDEGKEIVLFIDEFHQVVQLSPAAVEALKPLLADSGTRGIRVVAATTYIEFREYISKNQPLVERLQRINIQQPGKEMTIEILKGMARQYKVNNAIYNDGLYEQIYEITNRYIPANSQPRKSILVLDSMVGWHRLTGASMDMNLLAKVIYESEGINVAFRVDAKSIKNRLNKRVFAQERAVATIEERLQVCVADINNKSKPMASFLLSGSTGVGKTELCKALAEVLFEDRRNLIRFDMSEYANSNSLDKFRHEITSRVWERPYSIVLLDEVEKSCSEVTKLLLQILDDGRLSDQNNRETSFLNAYIILTTNAGAEVYDTIAQFESSDTGSGEGLKKFRKIIERSIVETQDGKFPPELLGRIDELVPFQPLSERTMEKIIMRRYLSLKKDVMDKHGIILEGDKAVLKYIVADNMDTHAKSGGARNAIRQFDSEVTAKVARAINENPGVKRLGVNVVGEMMSDNKNMLESRATIEIVKIL